MAIEENGKSFGSTEVSLKSLTKYINKGIDPTTENTDFSLRTFTTGYNKQGVIISGWGEINKWSRIKPVISENETYDYPEPAGALLNRMKNANYGLTSPGEYATWTSAYNESTGFVYQKPSDTGNNTFRLGDYRFYLHSTTVSEGVTESWLPITNYSLYRNGKSEKEPLDYQDLTDGKNWCTVVLPTPPAERIDGKIVTLLITMEELSETIYGETTPVPGKEKDPSWGTIFKYYYAIIAIRSDDNFSCILYSEKPINEYSLEEVRIQLPTYDSKYGDFGEKFAVKGTWTFHFIAAAKYKNDEILVETLDSATNRGIKYKKLPLSTSTKYYLTNSAIGKKLTLGISSLVLSYTSNWTSLEITANLNDKLTKSITITISGIRIKDSSSSTEDKSCDLVSSRVITFAAGESGNKSTGKIYYEDFNPGPDKPSFAEGNIVFIEGMTVIDPLFIDVSYNNYEVPSYNIEGGKDITIKGE